MTPVFNTHADRALLQCFQELGHRNVQALLEGHKVEVPKHASKPVCLVWALKGECSNQCRRKGQHVRCARSTIQSIHRMLDKCGVDSPQAGVSTQDSLQADTSSLPMTLPVLPKRQFPTAPKGLGPALDVKLLAKASTAVSYRS